MDNITTKAAIIGLSIFITLSVITLVITMFTKMQDIYGIVLTTDTSIHSLFDDVYSIYNGSVESGIGLLNTIKKFEDKTVPQNNNIEIIYPNCEEIRKYIKDYNKVVDEDEKLREAVYLKNIMLGQENAFEKKYNVIVYEAGQDQVIIEFSEIG